MRTEFARAIVALAAERRDLVFVTADLGYRAVEEIASVLGERFINAGVAEQNAVSLAAGLAYEGQLPWFYSMAAFTTLRPYAQIRDNVCFHRLPVKLVGNGGGYGYGIMGPTHHALQDVSAMRALPHMRVYLPLVAADVEPVVRMMADDPCPNYLRLNTPADLPGSVPIFAPWRKLQAGKSCVVVGTGPVLGALFEPPAALLLDELEVWSVGTFPLDDLPHELLTSIRAKGRLVIMEEHGRPGGLGEALSYELLRAGAAPRHFDALSAAFYPSGRFGSQRFHQAESDLRGPALAARLEAALRA